MLDGTANETIDRYLVNCETIEKMKQQMKIMNAVLMNKK